MEQFLTTKEFCSIAGIHRTTLERKKRDVQAVEPNSMLFIKKRHRCFYHYDLLEEYVGDAVLEKLSELEKTKKENEQIRRLLRCLKKPDSMEYFLYTQPWTYFGTVTYSRETSKEKSFAIMTSRFNRLMSKYSKFTELRMFFTTEKHTNSNGYHNHFMLYVENKEFMKAVKKGIMNASLDRIDVRRYDEGKAGVFYASKEGLQSVDWDILTSHPEREQ